MRNKVWVEKCREFYVDMFDNVFPLHYDHWESEKNTVDFAKEISKIAEIFTENAEQELCVFAKSIGTILAVRSVLDEVINPTKCVFFGVPFNLVIDSVFEEKIEVLKNFQTTTLAIHNKNDPTADHDLAKEIIEKLLPSFSLETLEGDDHKYLDFADYRHTISNFLNA